VSYPTDKRRGTITVEWSAGDDPNNIETYSWSIRCDPPIPDQLTSDILADVVRVY